MPRENSISDEGRSLTPDLEEAEGLQRSFSRPRSQLALGRRSVLSRTNASVTHPTSAWAHLLPKEKFKAAVRRIISIRRGITFGTTNGPAGDEPGVDPRRSSAEASYGHLNVPCEIEIIDYSAIRFASKKYTNEEFVNLMNVESSEPVPRPPWVKVRWINIGGISWDVLKALAIKYNIHPLALEDVLHKSTQSRSKADYYTQHLFISILCHYLVCRDASAVPTADPTTVDELPYMAPGEKLDGAVQNGGPSNNLRHRNSSILPTHSLDVRTGSWQSDGINSLSRLLMKEKAVQQQHENYKKKEMSLQAVKKGERVEVDISAISLFLFRDGTIISIHRTPSLALTAPVCNRLRLLDTVLRKSADPSLLIHAILDLIVDKALEVTEQYHVDITEYEHDILLRPKMKTVRLLHIVSGDLTFHKRTLEPIRTMIYALRRYDVDRVAALLDSSDPKNKDVQVVGFLSHKTKIYLADVLDHMEYILASLDMFSGIAGNLINYSFNMSSYEMNVVMRRLTLVTIVLLPMTVLTGYFGMNFNQFWSVQQHSDAFFWYIALPSLAFVTVLAMMSDIKALYSYIRKKSEIKKMIGMVFY